MEQERILSLGQGAVLTPGCIAAALKGYTPGARGDLENTKPPYREAAVLIPLIAREHGLHIVLTRRAEHLSLHAGQISFPGGGAEAADPDRIATALREAAEEIGLNAAAARVLGVLDSYITVSGFRVSPVVAHVDPQDWTPDLSEVAEIFEVPLLDALRALVVEERDFGFGKRRFHALTWRDYYV